MDGFRFVEVVSQCPTAYGRRAGFKEVGEMLKWFRENAIPVAEAEKMREEELEGKIVVGEFAQRKRLTLVESVYEVLKEAAQKDA
jgi:2-oxoglutarate ferredoxin oxidoreductase subunit beta